MACSAPLEKEWYTHRYELNFRETFAKVSLLRCERTKGKFRYSATKVLSGPTVFLRIDVPGQPHLPMLGSTYVEVVRRGPTCPAKSKGYVRCPAKPRGYV